MNRRGGLLCAACCLVVLSLAGRQTHAVTEVRLDKDFLAGIVEKFPPRPFEKKEQGDHPFLPAARHRRETPAVPGLLPGRGRVPAPSCGADLGTGQPLRLPCRWPSQVPVRDHHRSQCRSRCRRTATVPGGGRGGQEDQLEGIAGLLVKLMGRFFDRTCRMILPRMRITPEPEAQRRDPQASGGLQGLWALLRNRLCARPGDPPFRPDP